MDNIKSAVICVDVSTKLGSVACNCVKVQWLESEETTPIHQPINFINSGNVANIKNNNHKYIAPLIRSQPWRFINLFTYLLT